MDCLHNSFWNINPNFGPNGKFEEVEGGSHSAVLQPIAQYPYVSIFVCTYRLAQFEYGCAVWVHIRWHREGILPLRQLLLETAEWCYNYCLFISIFMSQLAAMKEIIAPRVCASWSGTWWSSLPDGVSPNLCRLLHQRCKRIICEFHSVCFSLWYFGNVVLSLESLDFLIWQLNVKGH